MLNKIIYKEDNHEYPIILYQDENEVFSVQYGLQLDSGLNFDEAASKLGQAIMHACSCDGLIKDTEE